MVLCLWATLVLFSAGGRNPDTLFGYCNSGDNLGHPPPALPREGVPQSHSKTDNAFRSEAFATNIHIRLISRQFYNQ